MATSPLPGPTDILLPSPSSAYPPDPMNQPRAGHAAMKPNQVGQVILYGIPIVSLVIDGQERLCLAQISNTLLKNFSYNEIHNRRVALGITCVQCTPVQLEILRRAGAMPISSRRCGMITKREAERLCKSFLGENRPPKLPDNFAFDVSHECAWGCRGSFIPARYNSSRAKCIKCSYCSMYFSPNKFIFHSHRTPDAKYTQPDAANFNSWRRHLKLTDKSPQDELVFAWEDVKAMFNGGSRKRALPPAPPAPAAAAPAACHPLGSVKAAAAVVGGGLLSPHLLAAPPELHQKRPRFDEDEELQEANQKSKESNQVILPMKEDTFSDKNKEHNFFITDSEPSGGDFWRDIAGEHTQETNSPHSLKKDVENMGKEELQKVLFEQIDLRRRLEQEFQVLKGNASFPVFNNFQDQMKRELAYREEMVQQLQIIEVLKKGAARIKRIILLRNVTDSGLNGLPAEVLRYGLKLISDMSHELRGFMGVAFPCTVHVSKPLGALSFTHGGASTGLVTISFASEILQHGMVRSGGGLHNTMVSKEGGSSASTYDIIMVSLSGSLLLLVTISIAIIVLRRHCTSNRSSKDLSTPVLVENITVTNNSSDKISTGDLTGPVCISYVSDKATGSPDLAISEEMISIFELPFFSFAFSITPPDSAPEQ
ncbi:Skor2 [Columba guinea]|nr:Skor2 [Columba guinea]